MTRVDAVLAMIGAACVAVLVLFGQPDTATTAPEQPAPSAPVVACAGLEAAYWPSPVGPITLRTCPELPPN